MAMQKSQTAEPVKFARFTVRKDGGLMLGKSFGLFEPDMIYEVTEILDELVIRKVGVSSIIKSTVSWEWDANQIVENGSHLLTVEELALKLKDGES